MTLPFSFEHFHRQSLVSGVILGRCFVDERVFLRCKGFEKSLYNKFDLLLPPRRVFPSTLSSVIANTHAVPGTGLGLSEVYKPTLLS